MLLIDGSALGHLAGSLLMGHYLDDDTCILGVMLFTIMLFEPSQISRDLYLSAVLGLRVGTLPA